VPVFDESGRVREWIGSSIDINERKLAEQALKESEERFRTLADNISQRAWMADDKGNMFWFNKRWGIYRTEPATWRKRTGRRCIIPIVKRVMESIIRSFGTGQGRDLPLRAADGTYCWFLARATDRNHASFDGSGRTRTLPTACEWSRRSGISRSTTC
jgi:PAS domain-containing protein